MIENIHIPIVSEFNYKFLHNILGTSSLVCKRDYSIDKFCVRCRDSEETPKHIIYDCQNVANISKTISTVFQFDIKWKYIVLGFSNDINENNIVYNNIISFIACRIFKYRMKCRIENREESERNTHYHVKSEFCSLESILKEKI